MSLRVVHLGRTGSTNRNRRSTDPHYASAARPIFNQVNRGNESIWVNALIVPARQRKKKKKQHVCNVRRQSEDDGRERNGKA